MVPKGGLIRFAKTLEFQKTLRKTRRTERTQRTRRVCRKQPVNNFTLLTATNEDDSIREWRPDLKG